MNNILSEKEYQKYILGKHQGIGYEVAPATDYDRLYAVNRIALCTSTDLAIALKGNTKIVVTTI